MRNTLVIKGKILPQDPFLTDLRYEMSATYKKTEYRLNRAKGYDIYKMKLGDTITLTPTGTFGALFFSQAYKRTSGNPDHIGMVIPIEGLRDPHGILNLPGDDIEIVSLGPNLETLIDDAGMRIIEHLRSKFHGTKKE